MIAEGHVPGCRSEPVPCGVAATVWPMRHHQPTPVAS